MSLRTYQSVHHVTGMHLGALQFQTGGAAPDLWVRTITVRGEGDALVELTLFAEDMNALKTEAEVRAEQSGPASIRREFVATVLNKEI